MPSTDASSEQAEQDESEAATDPSRDRSHTMSQTGKWRRLLKLRGTANSPLARNMASLCKQLPGLCRPVVFTFSSWASCGRILASPHPSPDCKHTPQIAAVPLHVCPQAVNCNPAESRETAVQEIRLDTTSTKLLHTTTRPSLGPSCCKRTFWKSRLGFRHGFVC